MKLGGDPDAIGYLSSLFALKISLMRENRKLVSQTFMYLMVPLHAVLIAILLFVTEVMVIFATQLNNIQTQAIANTDPTTTGGHRCHERPRVRVAEHRLHPRLRARRDDRADDRRYVVAARDVGRAPPQGVALRCRHAAAVRAAA